MNFWKSKLLGKLVNRKSSVFSESTEDRVAIFNEGFDEKVLRKINDPYLGSFDSLEAHLLEQSLIIGSEFDIDYYKSQPKYAEVAGLSPVEHYLLIGWRVGLNPSQDFDGSAYLQHHPDVMQTEINPFIHYLLHGRDEGRVAPGVLKNTSGDEEIIIAEFDEEFYLSQMRGTLPYGQTAIQHYLQQGWSQGLKPNREFDPLSYLQRYSDVAATGANPFCHYVLHGREEGRSPDPIGAEAAFIRNDFDPVAYLSSHPNLATSEVDLVKDYVKVGWKFGCKPTKDFDTTFYVQKYPEIVSTGVSPFFHYLRSGIVEGRFQNKFEEQASVIRTEFDTRFYFYDNPSVEKDVDPVLHYLKSGWREGRNPRRDFDTNDYLRLNIDVAIAGENPFYHYIKFGRAEGRSFKGAIQNTPAMIREAAMRAVQDHSFPLEAEKAEQVMVIIVPEHNEMSGGIYSFFSIARAVYALRHRHNFVVMLMTRPNRHNLTYVRQRNFRNSEDVFRFEQIVRCSRAKTVYIHVPEYAASGFPLSLSEEVTSYLKQRDRLYINILNQKVDFMPAADELEDLRSFAHELTQSVAHHAYFGQEFADKYTLPILLLPAFTDLSSYPAIPREEKKKLIIYSPDASPFREATLAALRSGLPDYELREIRGITFDRYMDLATQCMFSVTFGEGFDGYIAQPIYQGGIGFAVHNEEFFPVACSSKLFNIFADPERMVLEIVDRIKRLASDDAFFRTTNHAMLEIYDELYSQEDYMRCVDKLVRREFDLFPMQMESQQVWGRI